jgi:hypothetical protein
MNRRLGWLLIWLLFITGCQGFGSSNNGTQIPTLVALSTLEPSPENGPGTPATAKAGPATVPPTWTAPPPVRSATPAVAISTTPTLTPVPSNTPFPTFTVSATPSDTPQPTATIDITATAMATLTSTPTATLSAENLLPNPSFELGWYHVSGIAELQVPRDWFLGWHEGKNDLDPDPWNRYVRPESRILNGDFLPTDEHDLFIWDGQQTMKVFKRTGALYFWLATNVLLEPGSYLLEINVFPDMVSEYSEIGGKVWAPDPLSAELRFIHNGEVGNWIFPWFGQKNNFTYAFQVSESQSVRLGVAFRGRWAILNNGWFFDDWSLRQLFSGP